MAIRGISVLIATYNRPRELASCLRAIQMNKCGLDIEVCVVNDGGVSVEPVIRQFTDLTVRYVNLPANKGQVYCRNVALQMANHEWIGICDDDDRFLPCHLQRMHRVASDLENERSFLYSDVELVIRNADESQNPEVGRKPFAWKHAKELLANYNPIVPSSVFYHRSLHNIAGPFDETVEHYWDWDFWLRVRPFADFVRVKGCSVLYGIDGGGSNQSSNPETMKGALSKLVLKHGLGQLPTSNFLRMTEDPFLESYKAVTCSLWDGDMRIWE